MGGCKLHRDFLNGRLVSIESQREHEFILNQFRDVYGQDPSGAPVTLGWIGATDEDDQNSTIFDTATNTSTTIDLKCIRRKLEVDKWW